MDALSRVLEVDIVLPIKIAVEPKMGRSGISQWGIGLIFARYKPMLSKGN